MIKSFDEWFGEASQNKLFWESPSKASKMGFEAGQQSKQAEIDKLKMSNHYLSVQVIDAEAYSEYWKYQRDKLQKRIEDALEYIEPSDNINHKAYRDLYKILKGEPR